MPTAPVLAALVPAAPGLFTPPDLSGIGLVLSIVGSFLLANAILFRHPRALVREHFGKKPLHLRNIREYIFHRVQVSVGFAFLLSGFTLQLIGHYRPTPAAAEPSASAATPFPTMWVGLIVVLAAVLLGAAWWWSLIAFRRYVREYFLEHPVDFEVDGALAREVGELFGVVSYRDDTVQSYVARLHRAAGLVPDAGLRRPARRDDREEPEAPDLEEQLV